MFNKLIEEYRILRDTKAHKTPDRFWLSGVIFGLKRGASHIKNYPLKVTITVKGGVAYLDKCPRGVEVTINDLDNNE